MQALNRGNHQRYVDNPAELMRGEAVDDGNAILGHIPGSKDTSRALATRAAEQSGVDYGTLKKMLPLVAAMAMGSLGKQTTSLGQAGQQGGDLLSGLSSFLDAEKDGSVMDDLLDMARKLF